MFTTTAGKEKYHDACNEGRREKIVGKREEKWDGKSKEGKREKIREDKRGGNRRREEMK